MDHATVALLLAFSCAACTAATAATGRLFGYPDDDHVIITQYGPMRYKPVTADEMNRPYDGGGDARTSPSSAQSARGYYKAEVIPLDMKTWKPLSDGGGWVGRGAVGGGGGGGSAPTANRFDAFDVPLRVGYSVRSDAAAGGPLQRRPPVRRRRHDYFLLGYPPPPPMPKKYPGARPAAGLWRY